MSFATAVLRTAAASALIFGNLVNMAAQPEAADSIYKLPAGTRLRLKMDVELSSKVASANDTFTAAVVKPIIIRDSLVVPVGTVVEGRVRSSNASARAGGNGTLDVVFESMRIPNLPSRPIVAELVDPIVQKRSHFSNVLSVIGGTLAGAFIGASLKGTGGAVVGAAAGAGAGTAVAIAMKGKNVRIREDEEFEIVLKKDVVLPVLDY